MKKMIIATLLGLAYLGSKAQIRMQTTPKIQVPVNQTDLEKIKISFPQPPVIHDDGGWEKGPSNWSAAVSKPFAYRGGLLFLDRKTNGLVKYLMIELRFTQPGSIDVTANSMSTSKPGVNGWKTIFGKEGEIIKQTIVCTENDFGREVYLYLRNFRAYRKTQVN